MSIVRHVEIANQVKIVSLVILVIIVIGLSEKVKVAQYNAKSAYKYKC